jgi:hypothetical protein
MKIIEMEIECPSCKGTGIYSGMSESGGVGVICFTCEGTGKYRYSYSYEEFTGRKVRKGIKRVYLQSYGYKIGTGVIDFDKIGLIDMDKKGVSYEEFLSGKMPEHIEKLACPMLADQGACHSIKGFVTECTQLNKGFIGHISSCSYMVNKHKCWERFKQHSSEGVK